MNINDRIRVFVGRLYLDSKMNVPDGNVYVIKCEHIYKIGCSIHPKSRLSSISKKKSEFIDMSKSSIEFSVKTKYQYSVEQKLHKVFRGKSVKKFQSFYGKTINYETEWFRLSDDDLFRIKSTLVQPYLDAYLDNFVKPCRSNVPQTFQSPKWYLEYIGVLPTGNLTIDEQIEMAFGKGDTQ